MGERTDGETRQGGNQVHASMWAAIRLPEQGVLELPTNSHVYRPSTHRRSAATPQIRGAPGVQPPPRSAAAPPPLPAAGGSGPGRCGASPRTANEGGSVEAEQPIGTMQVPRMRTFTTNQPRPVLLQPVTTPPQTAPAAGGPRCPAWRGRGRSLGRRRSRTGRWRAGTRGHSLCREERTQHRGHMTEVAPLGMSNRSPAASMCMHARKPQTSPQCQHTHPSRRTSRA